ncbi:MAG: TrkH family potassium uptake protein [Treponema sp.]|jgi:trk system potassium uptake protein TrkH|nr:TrkH family potassium uptake protein [Treponema sp.]
MNPLNLARIPLLALGFSVPMMLPCLVMALVWGERARAFAVPMGLALALALPALLSLRKAKIQFYAKDGFLLVTLTWVFMSLLGAVPYLLAGPGMNLACAVFESACGFATTGATTVADVEALPRSLLFWRSTTHWFGGMGIILLTVALLPLLGVGGFQLIKAEAPGPEKDKVTPKITATAKILWLVYLTLTFALFLLYLFGGMEWFDALCHAFTIMASGGVSTKNAGIAHYGSAFIEVVTVIFMLLAGFNFNLYFRMVQGKGIDALRNTEARVYIGIFAVATVVIACSITPHYGSAGTALRYAAYQSASMMTTTGSAIADYELWPPLAQAVLFLLIGVGGCSGSTAGGIKVIRHAVLWKQTLNELRRMLYPQGVFTIRLNRKVGRKDVVYGVAGFVFLYALVVTLTTLLTAASGVDLLSAFSASAAVVGNVGLGFGAAGPSRNFSAFPDHVKWLFSCVMIAGRLELWTLFILFTPDYWRR